MAQVKSGWARIVEAADKPLGFYILALLIVESFLTIIITVADLDPSVKAYGMWAGIGLFVMIVATVTLCVWHKPTHLTYTGYDSLVEHGKASYGTESKQITEDDLPKGVSGSGARK